MMAQRRVPGWTEKFLSDFVYLLEHPKM
jgi:hypothetical protein